MIRGNKKKKSMSCVYEIRRVLNINDLNVEILITCFSLLDIKTLCSIEKGNLTLTKSWMESSNTNKTS